MTGVNTERLRAVMDFIDEHIEWWDQSSWLEVDPYTVDWEKVVKHPSDVGECGARACFAGWTAILAFEAEPLSKHDPTWLTLSRIDRRSDWEWRRVSDGQGAYKDALGTHIRHRAQVLLGLTDRDADDLFDANNTLTDLRVKVSHLLAANKEDVA